MIACSAFRWQHFNSAGFTIYFHMHKYIEANRYRIFCNTIFFQCCGQVSQTTPVRVIMTVNYSESICAAGVSKKSCLPTVSSVISSIILLLFEYKGCPVVRNIVSA